MFAALYWEEPDRSGHNFGPENTTAMAKALKEVTFSFCTFIGSLEALEVDPLKSFAKLLVQIPV